MNAPLYSIEYNAEVTEDHIPVLPKSIGQLIHSAIETRLRVAPHLYGKPLRHELRGYYSLRVSTYRIMYKIDFEQRHVKIVSIKHRKDVYEK